MTTAKNVFAVCCIAALPCAVLVLLGCNAQWMALVIAISILYAGKLENLAIALVVGIFVSVRALAATPGLLPNTYDAALCRLDNLLGIDHAAIMSLFAATPPVYLLAALVYLGFPIPIALACRFSPNPTLLCIKLASGSVLAFVLYFLVPACGPAYLFTSLASAPRNAFPSMHTSWALMLWLESRSAKLPARIGFDLNLLFTVIATIGTGEHYVVDLLAAVPFTMVVVHLINITPASSSWWYPRPVPPPSVQSD